MIKIFLTVKTEKWLRQIKWLPILVVTLGIIATILLASLISLYAYKI
ncbi:hypothetical protein N752_00630 [Desulforamulus aquiferis]|nr:hypothetical protein N752_00630 [Desulforamulus aquiferis]